MRTGWNCREERIGEASHRARVLARLRRENGGRQPKPRHLWFEMNSVRWTTCNIVHSKAFQNIFVATRAERHVPRGCWARVEQLVVEEGASSSGAEQTVASGGPGGGGTDGRRNGSAVYDLRQYEEQLAGMLRTRYHHEK